MQSCTSTNWMFFTLRLVSSLISRRSAASEVSPHLIFPPGMPHRSDHLCVRIINTSSARLKISAPTVARGGCDSSFFFNSGAKSVSYTHLRAHETRHDLVCRLLLEKKKTKKR